MQNKPYFFFGNRGSQKRGRGPTLGKNSQKSRFLGGGASLILQACSSCTVLNLQEGAYEFREGNPERHVVARLLCFPESRLHFTTFPQCCGWGFEGCVVKDHNFSFFYAPSLELKDQKLPPVNVAFIQL